MKCPNCQFINEIDADLSFERASGTLRNQTVDKWDNGTYYCMECGLTGPKNMIERLVAIFELLFRNKTLSCIILEDKVIESEKECRNCKLNYPLQYWSGYGWFHSNADGGPDLRCTNPEVIDKPNPDEMQDLVSEAAGAYKEYSKKGIEEWK